MAVAAGEELTLLPLLVAGLMSPEPYEDVAERSKAIGEALVGASESGFGCVDPFEYI